MREEREGIERKVAKRARGAKKRIMCRLQTHLCLNTQSLSLSSLVSFCLHIPFALAPSRSAPSPRIQARLCSYAPRWVCVCVSAYLCALLAPRGGYARDLCVCVRVKFINVTRAHLSVVLGIPLCPRNISRELQMISADILFLFFFVWRNFRDLWFIGFLRFNFRFGIFDFS